VKSVQNPLGLLGIEFLEFSSSKPEHMDLIFLELGFSKIKKFNGKPIILYRQNKINFLLNNDLTGYTSTFVEKHGPSIPSMGLRVKDADYALNEASRRGAKVADFANKDMPYPAIMGIGESLIYFISYENEANSIYNTDFIEIDEKIIVQDKGFLSIDHLTNNVHKGTMQQWSNFYKDIFGFQEIRYFSIRGQKTGLTSYALRSPCDSFCIPINEGDEKKSQIEEYLTEYHGPGIQHVALLSNDILYSLDMLTATSLETLDIHDKYYSNLFDKFPQFHDEHRKKIKNHQVLIDGNETESLLQVFTRNLFGPIFFEFIQREGCLGFGEGNFQALFESIERDQQKREVL